MILHLVVPGLFAPLREWQRSYGWTPRAPGLQTLLSGAEATAGAETGAHLLCAGLLGFDEDVPLPAAGCRRIAQGREDDGQAWACADPVHLRADVDSAILIESQPLALGEEEASALIAELHAIFGAEGWHFEAATPVQWYVRPPVGFELPILPGVREAGGNDVGVHLRSVRQAIEFKKFYAELQMALAQSPVNDERERRGRTAINALWFWGGGRVRPPAREARLRAVQADDDVLAGMASVAGVGAGRPSPEGALASGGDVFACLEDLRRSAAYDDLTDWEAALAGLDRDWFAPLARSLERRDVDELILYADGRSWRVRRRRGFARWRREAELARSLGLEVSG